MRRFIAIWLVMAWLPVFAAGSVPDILIYEEDTLFIINTPLEPYFEEFGDEIPGFVGCYAPSCPRGYRAIWLVEESTLYLTRITSCVDCLKELHDGDLEAMFGDGYKNGKVEASWVSEDIVSTSGAVLRSDVNDEGHLLFEYERHLKVSRGAVKKVTNISNLAYKKDRIPRVHLAAVEDTLFSSIAQGLKWEKLSEDLCDDDYVVIINSNGDVEAVKLKVEMEAEFDAYAKEGSIKHCNSKILNSVRHLKFDVMLMHGAPFDEQIRLELFYNPVAGRLERLSK